MFQSGLRNVQHCQLKTRNLNLKLMSKRDVNKSNFPQFPDKSVQYLCMFNHMTMSAV